jgi:hypothetical protein
VTKPSMLQWRFLPLCLSLVIIKGVITPKHLSWCCDATAENYADFSANSCSFLRMDHIMQLVINERWDNLESLYKAQFWSPFFDIDWR